MSMIARYASLLARVAAPVVLAASLSACSSIPDWVDPTTWIGSDNQGATEDTPTSPDTTQNSDAQNQASAQTPDLASIPAKPVPPSTADEQKEVSDSLAADRSRAQYSADALRGGTEPAAAPPPPASAAGSDIATPSFAAIGS